MPQKPRKRQTPTSSAPLFAGHKARWAHCCGVAAVSFSLLGVHHPCTAALLCICTVQQLPLTLARAAVSVKTLGRKRGANLNKSEILERLNLGSTVAENDDNLESYFVPTVALDDFLNDRYDLIRGAKGSGKSAILRMVTAPDKNHPTLADVVLLAATEHTGEPAFKRAFEPIMLDKVTDSALTNAWKIYLLNLALDAVEQLPSGAEKDSAVKFCEACGIRYRTTSPFRKIWWSVLRMLHLKNIEVGLDGVSIEFPDNPPDIWMEKNIIVDFPEALRLILDAFSKNNKRCWILMDRLDAAFQDRPELERRALRTLLIAYKDFMGHKELRLKLFFRTDLYDVVTAGGGFRELTHVSDRASPPISWDPDKLMQMLMERFAFNIQVCERYGFSKSDVLDPEMRAAVFFTIFPDQIAVGKRKGDSWAWICGRIRDGNNTRTPRDLTGLVVAAAQIEREQLALGRGVDLDGLISGPAVKMGLQALSRDKLGTTLLAENPELSSSILMFSGKRAEQNAVTLEQLYGSGWASIVDQLNRIGFLEKLPESWRVPTIYRGGLGIIQGAAFPKPKATIATDDDDDDE
jgi:hypothetical protein